MKPVWLLDVDGVVNALAKKGDKSVWPKDNWRSASVNTILDFNTNWFFPILWSIDVVDFICEMAEKIEIRWHTTWQEAAPANLAPALGLPEFSVAYAPEFRGLLEIQPESWWKKDAVNRVLTEENRRLIWTDDEIFYRPHVSCNLHHLFISPPSNTGLTPKNLNLIREFVDASD